MSYVYISFKKSVGCATVGFYDPAGEWNPESDHPTDEAAARRVIRLNGGHAKVDSGLLKALIAARDHLEYCGYGDKWERECAEETGLGKCIAEAIAQAEKEAT